jgi:actin-like ATPase involved in cell morphogenesis
MAACSLGPAFVTIRLRHNFWNFKTTTQGQFMIGIDLGTTNSLAAVWRNGAVELIPNALGEVLTPSAVFMGPDNTLLVGRAARDRWLLQPERGALTRDILPISVVMYFQTINL